MLATVIFYPIVVLYPALQFIEPSMMESVLQDWFVKLSRSTLNVIGHHIAQMDLCLKASMGSSSSIISFSCLLHHFSTTYICPHTRSNSIANQEFQAECTRHILVHRSYFVVFYFCQEHTTLVQTPTFNSFNIASTFFTLPMSEILT